MQQLSVSDRGYLRAAAMLSSMRHVVEELLWNSIDAGSTCIDVSIDSSCNIEVTDNGCGIDLVKYQDIIGKWNATSKDNDEQSYGFKGEALASIMAITEEVEIISKLSHDLSAHSMLFNRGSSVRDVIELRVVPMTISTQGTIVYIRNLFYNLGVRQKSIKISTELNCIKEFINRVSILHHGITWSLIDLSNNKVAYKLPSKPSVSERFRSLHSDSILQRMRMVSVTIDDYTLTGLVSPPIISSLHWNKEYQYLYLNNRPIRYSDSNFTLLDSSYSATLSADGGLSGPSTKHHEPSGAKLCIHPCFVLQLKCPPKDYDITSEPDKSRSFFYDNRKVKQVIKRMLVQLYEEHRPDLVRLLTDHCNQNIVGASSGGVATNKKKVTEVMDDIMNTEVVDTCETVESLYPIHYQSKPVLVLPMLDDVDTGYRSTGTSPSPSSKFFRAAFMSNSPVLKSPKNGSDTGSVLATTANQRDLWTPSSAAGGHVGPTKYNIDAVSARSATNRDKAALFDLLLCAEDDDGVAVSALSSSSDTQYYVNSPRAQVSAMAPPTDQNAPSYTYNNDSINVDNHVFTLPANPFSKFQQPSIVSKEMIENARVIGQVNNSLIIVEVRGVLLAVDQHAADERVKLEQYTKEFTDVTNGQFRANLACKAVREQVEVERGYLFPLTTYKDYLLSWKFKYELVEESQSLLKLVLLQVPLCMNEPLTVQDFIEFVSLLDKNNGEIPLMLLKPPSMHRILTSHSCRTAVKFGDKLDMEQCRSIIGLLGKTSYPFNCAHGRTSLYPLIELKDNKR
jgi:DNA mismatch repair protein MLH3